jgi:tetratricopeptide (TPR) repeat protein
MASELELLKVTLQKALAVSSQGSYERRLPDKAALPGIREVLKGLRALVVNTPSAEAWRTLALAEESLLHYPLAVAALESAIAMSGAPDRKDLKRLALLREYAAKWNALGLTPENLKSLGAFLESELGASPCDHSHRFTRAWLKHNRGAPEKVLKTLKQAGGHCDCEVLLNVV